MVIITLRNEWRLQMGTFKLKVRRSLQGFSSAAPAAAAAAPAAAAAAPAAAATATSVKVAALESISEDEATIESMDEALVYVISPKVRLGQAGG